MDKYKLPPRNTTNVNHDYNEVYELASEIIDSLVKERDELLESKQMYIRLYERELGDLRTQLAAHKAGRIGYASEFPDDANGEPDVGSIHENIRKLKAQLAEKDSKIEGLIDVLSTRDYAIKEYKAGLVEKDCLNCKMLLRQIDEANEVIKACAEASGVNECDAWTGSMLVEEITEICTDISILEEKVSILEEERTKWWSKADKPDDCYVTMEVVREKDKRIEELEKQKEHFHQKMIEHGIVNKELETKVDELEAVKNKLCIHHGGLPDDDALAGVDTLIQRIDELESECSAMAGDYQNFCEGCVIKHQGRECADKGALLLRVNELESRCDVEKIAENVFREKYCMFYSNDKPINEMTQWEQSMFSQIKSITQQVADYLKGE